jgi:hypothetical protein
MVDSLTSIVLPSTNRNRGCSMGRGKCSYNRLTFLYTSIALSFSLHWVLSNLGTLNILTSSSKGLETVGALNHLTLWGRESLSN